MTIYLINLFIVIITCTISHVMYKSGKVNSKLYSYFFLAIGLISLICVSGFRYKVGTDYANYLEIYTVFGNDPVNWLESEVGFDLLAKSLYKISTNPQFFFFITSMIINIGIVVFLRKNSEYFSLSMYFYITTFLYYATMNGLRQYIASVILISGYKFLLNGNFKKYIWFILGASLFHTTAFIMVPLFFTVRKDTFSKVNCLVVFIFIIAFIFYQPFVDILFSIIGESKYSNYEDVMKDASNGANILRVIVWMLPVIITFLYRKRALRLFGEKLNILLNLCIIGMFFMLLAYRQVFFARFCMYFDVYYLLLLPKICYMFDKKTNRIIFLVMVGGYFAYSTLLLLSGESWIYPYKYNLNLF